MLRILNDRKLSITELKATPQNLAALLKMLHTGTLSNNIARTVFEDMATTGEAPETIVQKKGLVQISDESAIDGIVDKIISTYPDEAERYRGGDKKLLGFLMGQVMKESKGKANPKLANQLLQQKLG